MAVNQGGVAPSLPSFAQAFSTHSLASMSPAPHVLRLPPLKRSHDDDQPLIKHDPDDDDDPAPPPSALRPAPSKRRRVTISGAPHPLNTDVPATPDQPNSTPISPVVMGFTITRDNPTAMEKVKSMLSVKQKQKALIEQRRGSVVAVMSPTVPPDAKTPRPRRPPNPTPSPTPHNTLPAPPISFARRRAEQLGSNKKKPADILISPREPHTEPAIQSAPPLPFGRFPMALPRLPSVLGAPDANVRRVATAVPPTPTRLSIQRSVTVPSSSSHPSTTSQRSPPAASVPIASTLVPPTPALLHHPADKAAFLAPFEIFYDALNDSKQLKTWLADQLQRSNSMIQALTHQQENLNQVVDSLVEKQVAPIRQEMAALQKRVEDLEDALRTATTTRHTFRNGITNSPMPTESYTFPPSSTVLEPSLSSRRRTELPRPHSPNWRPDPDVESDVDPRRIDTPRSLPLEPPPLPPPPRLSPRVPFEHPLKIGDRPSLSESGKLSRRNSVIVSDDG